MADIEYDFQPLSAGNIHHLLPLYHKVFGVKRSLKEIQAKYLADHTGITTQGHLAFYGGKAVSFFCAIPVIVQYSGITEISAQSCDSMTLPEHAGQGLFSKLGKMTDDLLKAKGVRFLWGFPNQNSEFYVKRTGWVAEEKMRCYSLPLNRLSKEALANKSIVFKQYFKRKTKKALQQLAVEDILPNSAISEFHGGTLRNKDFYQYKSFTPNYIIKINDTLVWVKSEGGLLIGDMELKSEPQCKKTLERLKSLASRLGLGRIIFQTSPGTALDRFLSKHYTGFDTWLIAYKNYNSNIPLHKLRFTYGDLDTF